MTWPHPWRQAPASCCSEDGGCDCSSCVVLLQALDDDALRTTTVSAPKVGWRTPGEMNARRGAFDTCCRVADSRSRLPAAAEHVRPSVPARALLRCSLSRCSAGASGRLACATCRSSGVISSSKRRSVACRWRHCEAERRFEISSCLPCSVSRSGWRLEHRTTTRRKSGSCADNPWLARCKKSAGHALLVENICGWIAVGRSWGGGSLLALRWLPSLSPLRSWWRVL